MSGGQLAIFISLFLAVDAVIVWVVLRGAAGGWNGLAEKHPQTTPIEPSETRRFQSFALGMFNLGFCIHVTADPERLHLMPVTPMRLLGMRPMSLPWEALDLKPPGRRKNWRTARVGVGLDLHGPAWCLGLAERRGSADA
ncbi:MAG: hypothetical protein AAFS11_02630 [Planctomycetota bacterium]